MGICSSYLCAVEVSPRNLLLLLILLMVLRNIFQKKNTKENKKKLEVLKDSLSDNREGWGQEKGKQASLMGSFSTMLGSGKEEHGDGKSDITLLS